MSGWSQLRRRAEQARTIAHTEGPRAVGERVLRNLMRRLGDTQILPLLPADVAYSAEVAARPAAVRVPAGTPLRVALVMAPPGGDSGGHTTIFRMVAGLERSGHRCVVYLYDRYGSPVAHHEAVIRSRWPQIRAQVRSALEAGDEADAWVATSWETAHVVARRFADLPGARLYFVQDFEPFFYPRGSEYALAEDTYRFGYDCIAVGHMVAQQLAGLGVRATVVPFAGDTAAYGVEHAGPRTGVAFYGRPSTARRGYSLGLLALHEFHRRRPDVPIHVFGAQVDQFPFPAVSHGIVSPQQINSIYNSCRAGLALAFTNISLVAQEMLAAGCVPVINDSPFNRLDLDNPFVCWAPPTPGALAEALVRQVDGDGGHPDPAAVSASVDRAGWGPSQEVFVRAVERAAWIPASPGRPDGPGAG